MVAISGGLVNACAQVATVWGTAVASGAGDRFGATEFTVSPSVDILFPRLIGSAQYMVDDFTRGNVTYTASTTSDLGYRNNCDKVIAVFMGTSGMPTETTVGQADYKHTITFAASLTKYLTLAYESTSSLVHELPTCLVTSISIASQSIPGYIDFSANYIADTLQLATAVNTNAVLAATTNTEAAGIERVTAKQSDTFRINTQGGGDVAGGDQLNITGFQLDLERPFEIVNEIAGSSASTAPVSSGPMTGTFNVNLKQLDSHAASYTVWAAETAQKFRLSFEGSQIGSGVNKRFTVKVARAKIIDAPGFAVTDVGRNPLSLTYQLAKPGSNPTGWTDSYPYFEIVNTLATSLLA